MRAVGDDVHGRRLRGPIVILWRAGMRIQEALAVAEADHDQRRGALIFTSRASTTPRSSRPSTLAANR